MKRNVFLKGIVSYSFSNFVIYFLGLVSVPLFISYFGLTKYGLWVVLLSLISYLANSQFGLGTVVSVLIAKSEDQNYHKTVFSRSLDILALIALILLGLGYMFYLHPTWTLKLVGNVPDQLVTEVLAAFFYLFLFFIFRMPFTVITAGFIGHQDVQLERLYTGILPQLLSFCALLLTRILNGDLVLLAKIIGIGNLITAIASAIHYKVRYNYLYSFEKKQLLKFPKKSQILQNGGIFFVAGLSSMIITNSDTLILSQMFGPDQVAGYAIVFKVFMIAFSVFFILNSAFWPIFGRAFAKNEISWIKTVFTESSVNFPLLAGLIWLGGIAFMQDFIKLWIGSEHAFIGLGVVFALGGYGYVASVINFQTGLLSSLNIGKPFMWIGILEAIVNLSLSVVLARWFGPSGVAYGTFLAALLVSFLLLPWAVRKFIHAELHFPWRIFISHFCFVVMPCLGIMLILTKSELNVVPLTALKVGLILCYIIGSSFFIPESTWLYAKSKLKFLR